MTIQSKLALILGAAVAGAVGASCLAFVGIQRGALLRAEAEKERVLLDSIRRVAHESLLSGDPLMLLDYLRFLRRQRPEVSRCRVLLEGDWQEVGPGSRAEGAPEDAGDGLRLIEDSLPAPTGGRPAPRVSVEVRLSQRLLHEAERRASRAMLRNVGAAGSALTLLGLLASFPLSLTMTRRIMRLRGALADTSEGRFGLAVDAGGADEIADLAHGFNEMSRRLGELEEMKRLFIASVSHELRSPLAAIGSHARKMASAAPPQAEREALDSIQRNASRLEHFVGAMLELSKIERGRLDFHPRSAEIGPVIEDTLLFFKARAQEAGLELEAAVEPGLPPFPFDPDLITQVLANLVSNAIKFTPKGGRVRLEAKRGGEAVTASVEDTGVGLKPEDLARIFSPFERVPNPMKATGTGLGLAISKGIVEMHGGRIGARSQPGKGSRFYFELPLKAPGR